MTVKPTINRSVPVGSSNKGPTVLPHVTVGNARKTASRHCPDQSKAWTLNKIGQPENLYLQHKKHRRRPQIRSTTNGARQHQMAHSRYQ